MESIHKRAKSKGKAREKHLVFGAPQIEEDEIAEAVASMRSGWLGTGPKVARFEVMFCQHVGSEHAMALNSCTAGLHLSLLVAGLGTGDEVITTPMTFCATANSIIHTEATPVFADCERDTQLIILQGLTLKNDTMNFNYGK